MNIRRLNLWTVTAALLTCLGQPAAVAITINIEYSTDFGGDESPSWDANGAILIAHFQAAKQIWESLLPGEGEYTFDFQWDDDIGDEKLGLYTPGIFDTFIELNPTINWFADPTPLDHSEFALAPTWFSDLTNVQKAFWFPEVAPVPSMLEVGYLGDGLINETLVNGVPVNTVSASGQVTSGTNPEQVDASNGFDLLSVILHEMGHALGLSGTEPGEWNIDPQHVGGIEDLLVAEDDDGGHLIGGQDAYWLMGSGLPPGERRLPSATDILVIAEDQGISNVKLARVSRLTAGNWSNSNAWIGADVPDATQDAYVRQAGAVTLDMNASVKSLVVDGGSSVDVTGFQLASAADILVGSGGAISLGVGGVVLAGDIQIDGGGAISVDAGVLASASGIRFDGGALSVGAGGTISADTIEGDPATLTTAAGSTIEFNNFTRGASSATAATFNGSVKIGVGEGEELVSFNPNAIATWNIGQNLSVGNFQRPAKLVIDNGAWSVGGNLDIPQGGAVEVDGGFLDETLNLTGGSLDVTGPVTINGGLTYRGRRASNTTYTLNGGSAYIINIPPTPPFLESTGGGQLIFENTTLGVPIGASVGTATINVGGGTGDGGDGAVVTFKGNSYAVDAEFWNGAGIGGISLRISNPVVIAGTGGRVIFEDNSYANTSHFRNDGVNAHGPGDSGGATYFRDDSYAANAEFDNYGSTLQSYTGAVGAPGGRTVFFDDASASFGTFNNHPGQGMGALGAGVTAFYGDSTADHGTFYNKGGVPGLQHGGSTEFYENASAGEAEFYNEHSPSLSQHAGTAGNVRFYGNSTAANATFYNQVGGGTVYFNDTSTAGDGHFFIEDTGTGTFGGHVVFNGNSKGGMSDITIKENAFSATIEFRGTSDAQNAEITLVNGSQAYIWVYDSASLGNANLDIGSGGSMIFRNSATAANSTIRLRPGGVADFTGINTTAANSTITLDGATVLNGGTGSLYFSGANAGNATIYVNGGTVWGAAGAQLSISNGTNAGTATIIGGGAAVPGAGGARITIDTSSNLTNATITVGAGGYLNINGFGAATVGTLELASGAAVYLNQTELRAGALNTSNTISGPIVGVNGNSKFTKVGTGTLTLTGANTYTGLTKVDGGTLAINGSTPGAVEVNSGAMLKGTGSINGTVTLNSGGTLAPGASPGTITIGSLAMMSGSSLDFELGATAYDRIIASGNMALAGTLNVSLFEGFMPSLGGMFDLFNWGTISGTFSAINLPELDPELGWDTSQLYTSGVLSVEAVSLPGNYNNDDIVNAADFVLWRDTLGSTTNLAANGNGNTVIDAGDYGVWNSNFGNAPSTGSGTNASVPEPHSLVILLLLMPLLRWKRS